MNTAQVEALTTNDHLPFNQLILPVEFLSDATVPDHVALLADESGCDGKQILTQKVLRLGGLTLDKW